MSQIIGILSQTIESHCKQSNDIFKATVLTSLNQFLPSVFVTFEWPGVPTPWVFVYRHWCEENEMVFVSHEVPFPATSDRRSRVAGNGTECEVKTIELFSPTSGGEQWAFLNFIILTVVKKTVPKLRKIIFFHTFCHYWRRSPQKLP